MSTAGRYDTPPGAKFALKRNVKVNVAIRYRRRRRFFTALFAEAVFEVGVGVLVARVLTPSAAVLRQMSTAGRYDTPPGAKFALKRNVKVNVAIRRRTSIVGG